jgi:hypothetical protein
MHAENTIICSQWQTIAQDILVRSATMVPYLCALIASRKSSNGRDQVCCFPVTHSPCNSFGHGQLIKAPHELRLPPSAQVRVQIITRSGASTTLDITETHPLNVLQSHIFNACLMPKFVQPEALSVQAGI